MAISVQVQRSHARRCRSAPATPSATDGRARARAARACASRSPACRQNVVFDGTVRGSRLSGTVRQGTLRGSVRAAPRRLADRAAPRPVPRAPAGAGVTVARAARQACRRRLIELPSGATHGIGPSLTVGERARRHERQRRDRGRRDGLHVERNALRAARACGSGKCASASTRRRSRCRPAPDRSRRRRWCTARRRSTRAEFEVFAAYFELIGIAVLADDKRGVGQSRGSYPGDLATDATIELLARDAQAEVALPREAAAHRPASGSASSATARRAGSSRSPPRASRRCAGRSRTRARR